MRRPFPSRRAPRPAPTGPLATVSTLAALVTLAPLSTLCWTGSAEAHPHVFVTAKEQVVFGPDGRVTGVRADWTFDDMYSSFVTQGLGTPGQLLTKEELAPLAKTNVENLAEWGYFTRVKLGSQNLAFAEPIDYWIDESPDKLVTLHYTLPLKVPVSAVPALNVQVYDPTYFVDFKMAEHDPVALVSAPAGCSVSVIKPRPLDASDNQKLSEAFFANMSPGTDFGIKLASKLMVACP